VDPFCFHVGDGKHFCDLLQNFRQQVDFCFHEVTSSSHGQVPVVSFAGASPRTAPPSPALPIVSRSSGRSEVLQVNDQHANHVIMQGTADAARSVSLLPGAPGALVDYS